MKTLSFTTLLLLSIFLCSCASNDLNPSPQIKAVPEGWQPQNADEKLCLTSNVEISKAEFSTPKKDRTLLFRQGAKNIDKGVTGQLDKTKSRYYTANLKVENVTWMEKVVYSNEDKTHQIVSIELAGKGNGNAVHSKYSSLLVLDSYVNLPSGKVVNARDCYFINFTE